MPPATLFATHLADDLGLPVINASHGGTTVASNRAELERLGPEYEPDIVLLYQMSNDIDLISPSASLTAGPQVPRQERPRPATPLRRSRLGSRA